LIGYAVAIAFLLGAFAAFLINLLRIPDTWVIAGEFVCLSMVLIGLWMFASPEPSRFAQESGFEFRRMIRASASLLGLTVLAAALVPKDSIFEDSIGIASVAISMTLILSAVSYARRLTLRLSSPLLLDTLRFLLIGWSLLAGLVLAGLTEKLWRPRSHSLLLVSCLVLILLLLLAVVSLIAGISLRRALGAVKLEAAGSNNQRNDEQVYKV